MAEPTSSGGFFSSLRRLGATALEMAQVRLELLSTEIEREKRRILQGLAWGAVAIVLLGMGLVLLCGFVILLFWDSYRLAAVGTLAAVFLLGSALLLRKALQLLHTPAGLFATSAVELRRDSAHLKNPSHDA